MLIELPEPQAESLQPYCRQANISESDALRQALAQFLPAPAAPKPSLRGHPAFGHWRNKQQEGLAYQYRLRDEWPA
jgi:hypothetical protein